MGNPPHVEILCDGNDKVGFGHVRRCQTLAAHLRRDGMLVGMTKRSDQSFMLLPKTSKVDSLPYLTIFDTPLDINEEVSTLTRQGHCIFALDYFGNALPDVNIAVYAHEQVRARRQSYVGFEYILIRDEIARLRGNPQSYRSGRVMVMVGGGDILGQGHLAAQVLVRAGCSVTLIQGPYASGSQMSPDYEVLVNPPNLPELFVGCDWAVTSGGGSLFEGLALAKAVHVLPQTPAEERIARHVYFQGGLLGIGLYSLRKYSVNEVNDVAFKGATMVDGNGAQRILKIVRSWL